MIVHAPKIKKDKLFTTISVDLQWENHDQKNDTVIFNIPADYVADEISINTALAIALSLPALHKGENRLKLPVPIDPATLNGILYVLAQQSGWFGYNHKEFTIEADTHNLAVTKKRAPRAGSFFSGGVDSFWTLKRNHTTLPLEHPLRIRDIIFVFGFDIGWKENQPGNTNLYDDTTELFKDFCLNNNLNVINIRTNIRHIFDDSNFWAARWHGMVLSSISYLLSNKLTDIFIPATNDLWHPDAWGTSPLIEPYLSNQDIHLYHDGADHTRLDKVKFIARWPDELKPLRICTKTDDIPDGFLNCGKCEKCLRTKLELIASGIDPDTIGSFSVPGIDLERLHKISPSTLYLASEYEELLDPLNALNRTDLTIPIESIIEKWTKWSDWKNEKTTTGLLKQLIRKFLKSWPPTPNPQPMKIK
ncbi:hypothetical protein [Sedimenticola thiotaurini]|uniref:hypothetical protein n=1 Tax=Sedimenticola thiotaurini TaxID=1543721 RepID=UPI0019001C05|nr:hypothetical protein [Sedimenticola thiotaurini]